MICSPPSVCDGAALLMPLVQAHAGGEVGVVPLAVHFVISEGLRELDAVIEVDLNALDELVGVGAAEAGFAFVLLGVVLMLGADVLEVVNAADDHFASGGGAVVLEHLVKCLEEDLEVGIGETGALGESGGHVGFGGVEGVGDDVLVAHGAFLFGVLLLGNGAAGDGNLQMG